MKAFCTLALLYGLFAAPALADEAHNLAALKGKLSGQWASISCELRPTENRAKPDAAPSSTWLRRVFSYDGADHFDGTISMFADPLCSVPMVDFHFAGDVVWRGAHPVAAGAMKNDYVLNTAFNITPKAQAFADQMNALPPGTCGAGEWKVGETKDILGKACALFNIKAGETVEDHDLIWVDDTGQWLFMGAKHVTGQGFYEEALRPPGGFQVPLRKQ